MTDANKISELELNPNTIDYEDVLEKIGYGKTQWIILIISGVLILASTSSQFTVGFVALSSQCEFNFTQNQKGIMMASCIAGIFLSTYFWGFASDALGRRKIILYSMFTCCTLQLILIFTTNFWAYNVINLLLGIFLGGLLATIYAYLSEFNEPRHRTTAINFCGAFVSVAAIYVPAISLLLLTSEWSSECIPGFKFNAWRLIHLFYLIPGLIGTCMLIPFPESPKFLLSQKKEKEALEAVDWICKFNTSQPLTVILNKQSFELSAEPVSEDIISTGQYGLGIIKSIWNATLPLFRKPHGRNFCVSAISVFLMFFCGNSMLVWFPEIVSRTTTGSLYLNKSATICEYLDASVFLNATKNLAGANVEEDHCSFNYNTETFIINIILGSAFFVGFIIQGFVVNPFGRKNYLVGVLLISTLSILLLQFIKNSTIELLLLGTYIVMPSLTITVMISVIVDFVPTYLRAKAIGICLPIGRLGTIAANNFISTTMTSHCEITYAVLTVAMFISAVLVGLLPIIKINRK